MFSHIGKIFCQLEHLVNIQLTWPFADTCCYLQPMTWSLDCRKRAMRNQKKFPARCRCVTYNFLAGQVTPYVLNPVYIIPEPLLALQPENCVHFQNSLQESLMQASIYLCSSGIRVTAAQLSLVSNSFRNHITSSKSILCWQTFGPLPR